MLTKADSVPYNAVRATHGIKVGLFKNVKTFHNGMYEMPIL